SDNQVFNGGCTGCTSYGVDINVFNGDLLQHLNCTGSSCGGTQTRLNTSFGSITYAANGARGNYDGIFAAIKGRFARRGFLTASYTRSDAKDDWNTYPGVYPYGSFYSPSSWNAPNRFSLGWSYELPGSGRGHGLFGRVTSGWTLAGVTTMQSGTPFTVYTSAAFHGLLIDPTQPPSVANLAFAPDSGDFNADGNNYDYPNVSSYSQPKDRTSFRNGIFPRCAGTNLDNCGPFSLPALGQEGNERVNQFHNPGFAQTDLAVKKATAITERVALELRLDMLNAFNRVNLNNVDANANDGANFGAVSGANIPRNMIVSARITF
ncbi:MAG: hypothetical protein DMG78_27215, partial [Acidobacteria bacterium]